MNGILIIFLLVPSLLFTPKMVNSQSCGNQIGPIRSMEPHFGGTNGFYSIAKGISDGLQSTPNQKTYNDLNNLFFGNGNITTSVVAKDLIYNQIGAIIFWSIGFVFVLAAIVLLVATAIWQCCFSCVPKHGSRSDVVGFIYLGLLFTIFSFILTGTILFNIATNDLVGSVDDGLDYTNEISNDIQQVLTNGTGQLNCAVNETTNNIFSQMEGILGNYSETVIGNTEQQTGYTALYNFDSPGLATQNGVTETAQTKLGNILNTITTGGTCDDQKKKFTDQFHSITTNLNAFTAAGRSVAVAMGPLTSEIQKMQNTIQENTQSAMNQMNSTQDNISSSIDSINKMVDDLQVDIKNVMNSLKVAHNDIVTSSQYSLVKLLVRLFLNLFACFAMLLAVYAMAAIAFQIKKKQEKIPNFVPLIVLISFYISIFLAIVMILLSSAAFVGGWVVSAMCVPTFQDPDYRIFHLINRETPSMNPGQVDTFNVGDVFTSCNSQDETIYKAINGSNIISADDINSQLNLDSVLNQTNAEILKYPSPHFYYDLTALKIQELSNSLETVKTATLDSCSNTDANEAVAEYVKQLSFSVQMCNQLYSDIDYLNNNVNMTQKILIEQNNITFTSGEKQINDSINALITNLQTNVFKCRPLVDIYNNGGYVVCGQYGKPIHGLWAAVGLAGLFMFTLSILLLLTYRWLKKENDEKHENLPKGRKPDNDSRSPVFSENRYNDTPVVGANGEDPVMSPKSKKSKKATKSSKEGSSELANDNKTASKEEARPATGGNIPRINTVYPYDDYVLPAQQPSYDVSYARKGLPRQQMMDDIDTGRRLPRQQYADGFDPTETPRGLRRM